MSIRMFTAAALTAAFALAALPAEAHSGHDHGDAASQPPAIVTQAQPGFGADGTAFQAVLVPEEGGTTLLYLAHLDTNAPVADAVIEAEAPGWQGTAQPTGSEGIYRLAWIPPPQGADMSLLVLAGTLDDLILISVAAAPANAEPAEPPRPWLAWGALVAAGFGVLAGAILLRRRKMAAAMLVAMLAGGGDALAHAGHDHGDGAAEPVAAAAAPGAAITMSKATQFLLGIRTARVEPREASDSQRVLGRVVPDPAGFAKVQPSQPSRVVSDPAFPLPVPGQKVTKGQVLVVMEPTLTSVERSDTRASLYRVESEIAINERELARQEALAGVLPAKTIETTRIRLNQLRREKAQIAGTALGRDLVTAPVDGIITDVHVVPGEVVTPDNVMVEIVDPNLLRVEAVIHDLATAGRISGAKAATRLIPDEVFTLSLLGVSPRIDVRDQGIHALFQVNAEQAPRLRLGLPVDVYLATGATRMATSVPRDAVAELGGKRVVFVRIAPETFEARPVTIRQIIGPLAEIDGVASGELVVIQGVDQLRAVR